MYSWNHFLNLVIKLKKELENKNIPYDYNLIGNQKNETCINHWLDLLNEPKWKYIFSGVQLNQYKDYITVHYSKFFHAFDENGKDVSYRNFFDVYNGLYRDCRGLVIDVKNEKLVLTPFKKFFNLNEVEETSMDKIKERLEKAKNIEISNKMDGSMISSGFYNGQIVISSSTMCDPEVSGIVKNSIKYIAEHINYKKMIEENPKLTFIFEHIFPIIDPHIVVYKKTGLYLIGVRDKEDGREFSYSEIKSFADQYSVLMTEVYNQSFKDTLNHLSDKKANEAEGFVVNIDGYRLKVKYDDYLFVHRTIANIVSANTIIIAMNDGNIDDLISKIPEAYKPQALQIVDIINGYLVELEKKIFDYYIQMKDYEKKEAMRWIDQNVPKKYRVYVRNKYLNNEYSYLKNFNGHYKTYKELEELVRGD